MLTFVFYYSHIFCYLETCRHFHWGLWCFVSGSYCKSQAHRQWLHMYESSDTSENLSQISEQISFHFTILVNKQNISCNHKPINSFMQNNVYHKPHVKSPVLVLDGERKKQTTDRLANLVHRTTMSKEWPSFRSIYFICSMGTVRYRTVLAPVTVTVQVDPTSCLGDVSWGVDG
jgi:hypothetical protein